MIAVHLEAKHVLKLGYLRQCQEFSNMIWFNLQKSFNVNSIKFDFFLWKLCSMSFKTRLTNNALLAWRYPKLKNKWPQNSYIFLIPLNIPDFAASIVFLICVRLPGGAAIIFSQSWNFELKFFVDNSFVKKIGTTCLWVHILPKNKVKIWKN